MERSEMSEIIYYTKDGKRHKKPPKGVPEFRYKPPINGEGCSIKDGIPCRAVLDFEVRRCAKSRKSVSREEV
jgi:hypothetical protein